MSTLSKHRNRPAQRPLDLRAVPVSAVMGKYDEAVKYLNQFGDGDKAYPEHEAILFYLANAHYAKVAQRVGPDDPLGTFEPLVERYHEIVRTTSLRMFFYLLLICTRESRHMKANAVLEKHLREAYGCMDFTKSIRNNTSDAVEHVMRYSPPSLPMGHYTDHLVEVFMKGIWSPQYGGKKWGAIAKVLRNFVHGVISPELLLDTGFTLAHNGGPIFNKQVLCHNYENKELMKVLDVQRAGMIPQLVATQASTKVTHNHMKLNNEAAELLGDECFGPVDWSTVMKLGATQNYAHMLPKTVAPGAKKKAAPAVVFITPHHQLQKSVLKRVAS